MHHLPKYKSNPSGHTFYNCFIITFHLSLVSDTKYQDRANLTILTNTGTSATSFIRFPHFKFTEQSVALNWHNQLLKFKPTHPWQFFHEFLASFLLPQQFSSSVVEESIGVTGLFLWKDIFRLAISFKFMNLSLPKYIKINTNLMLVCYYLFSFTEKNTKNARIVLKTHTQSHFT